jgi:hypothetical protein
MPKDDDMFEYQLPLFSIARETTSNIRVITNPIVGAGSLCVGWIIYPLDCAHENLVQVIVLCG